MSRGVASTSRRTALKLLGAGLASVGVSRVSAFETVERNDLITLFVAAGVVGCFAVFDPSREGIILVNGPRARRRFPPGHTVEIVQGLIAAEVGVYKFDSATLRSNNRIISERWKSTHIGTLENINDSFPLSAWKAKEIGVNRYSEWLDRLDYGNAAVGDDVERIWGDGPLEISAVEQVEFLAKLALGELPASRDAQAVTWDSNRVEKKGDAFLYAKQGRVSTRASEIAWWVGWVERGDDIAAFALNYDIKPKGSHDMRVSLGRAFLASLGLY